MAWNWKPYVFIFSFWSFKGISHLLEWQSCVFCAKRCAAVTCSIREMSQGRAPLWASSTIFCLVESGSGLPFTNTPPSWFTPLWPTWRQKHRSHHNGVKKPAASTCNKANDSTEWWGGWRKRSVDLRLSWRQKKFHLSQLEENKNVYRRPGNRFVT